MYDTQIKEYKEFDRPASADAIILCMENDMHSAMHKFMRLLLAHNEMRLIRFNCEIEICFRHHTKMYVAQK